MQESFLHYIWQFQYFDKKDLKTTGGDSIDVFSLGMLNANSGPDFSEAKIKIGEMSWAGNVEIHTKSSNWNDHGHSDDPAYENVILHVVWENDNPIYRKDKTAIPTLQLSGRVDESLITFYQKLINSPSSIPCERSFPEVADVVKFSMLDKALMQRLSNKADQVYLLLKQCNNDWEEVTYQMLARNFGFKINNDPFFQLSNSVQRKLLLKHSDNLTQIEALLFGQAGFLDHGLKEEYPKTLQREHKFLSAKYSLANQKIDKMQWRFLRLRPANFPTIRIAQFAALFFKHGNLFSKLIEAQSDKELRSLFEVNTSEYWNDHYRFGRKTESSLSHIGKDSIDNLIINSVVPLLVAYGKLNDDQTFVDRAIDFLQRIPAENNKIVKAWNSIGMVARSASDSQGLIELNNNFCLKRRCLSCAIGVSLLKPQG